MNKNRIATAKKTGQRNLKIMISTGRKLFDSPFNEWESSSQDTLPSIPFYEGPLVNIRSKTQAQFLRA